MQLFSRLCYDPLNSESFSTCKQIIFRLVPGRVRRWSSLDNAAAEKNRGDIDFGDNFTILRIDVISRSRGRKWASSSWTPCAPALMDVDLKIRSFSRAAAVRLWTSTLQATLVLLESFCQPRSTDYIKFFCAWSLFGRIVFMDGRTLLRSCIVLYRRQ